MADNILVTPGTGKEIAADDVGGILHQRVKLTVGNDGVSDGDISLDNPLPTRGVAQTFDSSTAALAASGTYTSSTFDSITGKAYITFSIFSVTDLTVSFQESTDSFNWTETEARFVTAGRANHGSMKISGRYGRVVVTNGSTSNAGGISNLHIMISNTDVITNSQIALEDSYGIPIGGVSAGAPSNGLAVALVATAYKFSTVNSTSAQLGAGATFTGTPEITFNQPSYSILLVSDQPGTLILNQYIDSGGTQLVQQETFSLGANEKFARSNVVNGNYFSISYQNTGGSATTTLRIDVAYGTIPSSTQLNNSPTALREVNGSPISLGQNTMANSLPVVLASNQSTVPVSASSLPLPSGAATSAKQSDGSQKTQIVDGSGNVISSTSNALDVNLKSGITVDVALSQASDSVAVYGNDGSTNRVLKTDSSGELQVDVLSSALPTGAATETTLASIDSKTPALVSGRQPVDGSGVTQPVSAASLPLPTGAATSANQATEIASLSSIDGKLNSLGQKAMSASVPVVISSDQSQISVLAPKDTGRNNTNFFMDNYIVTTATDTLMSLTGYKSGAAVTATTTPAVVTSGKKYRITSITIAYIGVATDGSAQFTLRANTGGVVAIGSPAVGRWMIGGSTSAAGDHQTASIPIPDGLEFNAGTGIGISMLGRNATAGAAAVGYGQISIQGYEY